MRFSLILNSRGRPQLLKDLFDSIQANTKHLNGIEVLIRFDIDDPTLQQNEDLITSPYYGFKRYGWADSRVNNIDVETNKLALKSKGKYVFVLNDDCVVTNRDWDYYVWNQLEDYLEDKKDGVVYGRTIDNSCDKVNHKMYASFPIISRKAIDILGFFVHNEFVGLGGDVAIYRVYEALNRIVDVFVVVGHVLHSTVQQVINPDDTAYFMRQNTYQNPIDGWSFDISKDIKKLQKAINA